MRESRSRHIRDWGFHISEPTSEAVADLRLSKAARWRLLELGWDKEAWPNTGVAVV